MTSKTAREILHNARQALARGWWLDGAGPVRYGWAKIHACKNEFVGATLQICIDRATSKLGENEAQDQ